MGILSKAHGTNIDDDTQIQSNKYLDSIPPHTPPLNHHHGVALEALLLSGVLNVPSAKICGG